MRRDSSSRDPIPSPPADSATLSTLRRILLVILLLEMFGITAELLLTGHTEDWLQWVPLALMAAATGVVGWHAAGRAPASLRAFRVIMILFLISGVAGVLLHYRAKAEFQIEMDPSLAGMALFWTAIQTKSPPPLAPGAMIQMGLLGLAYGYRHPALRGLKREDEKPQRSIR